MKALPFLAGLLAAGSLQADVVFCTTGDQLRGKVISVNESEVVLKSEIAGELKIGRAKVTSITFEPGATPPRPAAALPRPGAKPEAALSEIKTEDIAKVQQEFLATATPEAQAMFNETVQGVLSGKISMQDLRGQAQDALTQLEELSKDLGEDEEGELLGTYSAILKNFLKQTGGAVTNRAPAKPVIEDETVTE